MEIVFWTSLVLMLSVYAIYPTIIFLTSKLVRKNFKRHEIWPTVQLVIAAYNEEKNIAKKIENTLLLDYPKEKLSITIGSDGSSDKTVEIVRKYKPQGIELLAFDKNRGKTAAQNDCVRMSSSDIIVFMDAASMCPPGALKKIINNFADERVGCVAGRVQYISHDENLVTDSQKLYWSYETLLKSWESQLGILIGVDGPLYAIRRELYKPLDPALISDFMTPLIVRQQKFSVILEPQAVTYEQANERSKDELRARKRVTVRALDSLFRYPDTFNPFTSPILLSQIFVRKILRWLGGLLFIGVLLSSAILSRNVFYLPAFIGSLLILILGAIGMLSTSRKSILIKAPYYFVLVHAAGLLGFVDFLLGKRVIRWEPVRE